MEFKNITQVIGCAYTYKVSQAVRDSLSKGRDDHSSHVGDQAFSYYKKIEKISYLAKNNEPLTLRRHPETDKSVNHWYEPELAVLLGENHKIIGCSLANDFTASGLEFEKDKEGYDSTYYGKCWEGSCGLLESFTNMENIPDINHLDIGLKIERNGEIIYNLTYNTSMRLREFSELPKMIVDYYRSFGVKLRSSKQILIDENGCLPAGTVILVGTGLITPKRCWAEAGDIVTVYSPVLGKLRNSVKFFDKKIENKNNQNEVVKFVNDFYVPNVIQGLKNFSEADLELASNEIIETIKNGNTIYAFGNGGSEAIAEHLIYSLEKTVDYKFPFTSYGNPKLSEITDACNCELFNQRIIRSGKAGDLAFLISASGDSVNINNLSVLCRRKGVNTISLSGTGRISNDLETKAGLSLVVPIKDQQIMEDTTQCIIHILVKITQSKLSGEIKTVKEIKNEYLGKIIAGLENINVGKLEDVVSDIVLAFKKSKKIRLDAPDSGILSISAGHTTHNLKWDALSDIKQRPTNLVFSGIPTCHFTGVGNDGGDGFNYALEIADNFDAGDVQIIFAKKQNSRSTKSLIEAARSNGMVVHLFDFGEDEFVGGDVSQSVGHLIGRITNAKLIFAQRLMQDLALLRVKDETKAKLKLKYEI